MEQRITATPPELPAFAQGRVNLADAGLGACVVDATDEFFAPAARMLAAHAPEFYPDLFDDHGKWMDGWETRRRRGRGHDHCTVRLAYPAIVHGVDLDTSFFTGNFAPGVALEGCFHPDGDPDDDAPWQPLLGATTLRGDQHHFQPVSVAQPITHLRVHLYPDGGLARLRVYGDVWCDWSERDPAQLHDLAALANGGREIACNDAHYGRPMNLLRPGRGVNMGDGWETRRRREPGHDWCIIALGHPGTIERVVVDTAHFKGNFPDRCSLQAARLEVGTPESIVTESQFWETLLPEQPLEADSEHTFEDAVAQLGPVSHVRFNIHPDGGASRLRLWGRPER